MVCEGRVASGHAAIEGADDDSLAHIRLAPNRATFAAGQSKAEELRRVGGQQVVVAVGICVHEPVQPGQLLDLASGETWLRIQPSHCGKRGRGVRRESHGRPPATGELWLF